MIIKKSVMEAKCEICKLDVMDANLIIDGDKKYFACHRCTEQIEKNHPDNITESVIFTDTQLAILRDRLNGTKPADHGVFGKSVKPKINEMLRWFEKKEELEKLIS